MRIADIRRRLAAATLCVRAQRCRHQYAADHCTGTQLKELTSFHVALLPVGRSARRITGL